MSRPKHHALILQDGPAHRETADQVAGVSDGDRDWLPQALAADMPKPGHVIDLAALSWIGPDGFEPSFPDPKSGVLPLDEGPSVSCQRTGI